MIIGEMSQYFFGLAICFSSLFLVLLVLVQRGRGGGLTGALGGPGGQSAFGTKAGDLFTKITVGVAAAWIFLCASSVYFLKTKAPPKLTDGSTSNTTSSIGGTDDDAAGSSGTTDSTTPAGTAEVISEDAFATDAGDESEAAGEEAAADAATNENTEPNEGADRTGPEEDTDASSTGSDQ